MSDATESDTIEIPMETLVAIITEIKAREIEQEKMAKMELSEEELGEVAETWLYRNTDG